MTKLYAGFAIEADRLNYFIAQIDEARDRPTMYYADAAHGSTWVEGSVYQVTRLIGVLADHGEDVLRRVQERKPNLGDRIRRVA